MTTPELCAYFTQDSFTVESAPSAEKDGYFDEALLAAFSADKYNALFQMGFVQKNPQEAPSLGFLHTLALAFAAALSRDSTLEITRRAPPLALDAGAELLSALPYAVGAEYISMAWLSEQWRALSVVADGELAAFSGSTQAYLQHKNSALSPVGRVYFHLVESKDEDYPFAFLATYSTGTKDKVSHLPLENALLEFQRDQKKLLALLAAVTRACEQSALLTELVESGELFSPLRFTAAEAYVFLSEVPLYEASGVVCRIPDWWKRKGGTRLSVAVGEKEPSVLGLDALLSFQPTLFLDGAEMTKAEAEGLLNQTNGLYFIKGKWVEVNHDKLAAALAAFSRAEMVSGMTFAQAMRMELGLENAVSAAGDLPVQMTNGKWLHEMRGRLLHPADAQELCAGEDFKAALRHYQQAGLNWLGMMKGLGFGALLADDMGLGKTVQILALLEALRQSGASSKALLILPASLLCNWQKEAERFAPKLRLCVIHAQSRAFDLSAADVFITTYGMALRVEELHQAAWDLIILDEAQAIKNPSTKQTKAIKQLHGATRIAMTGTPIENRLSDLWSIFDFLNQGLLGTAKEFTDFSKRLKADGRGYARLREMISPFILRRLKTDRTVIADLPEKLELRDYTTLSKKQVLLYRELIENLKKSLEGADGIQRRGLVLASVSKLKQICNHPDQYLGQSQFEEKYSGKFETLAEICETIAQKHERVLVFTQFREMTEPLCDFLEPIFGKRGLVLHGGTTVKKRGELVERFNGEEYVPYMVLSLKAGGVGLNLTAANHVIHFDRWWNPAVENQATDRAFRIGQKKNVMVHKLITSGTLEEKIDQMLVSKQGLADELIAKSGEGWITELDNEGIMRLFCLEV
ncbi:MAG: DEAD/DEAH box helicase [Clostridia bacterium]